MRLDLFLKLSHLVPRRTIAKQLCEESFVILNQRPAKASMPVAVGDVLEFSYRGRRRVVKVQEIPSRQISKKTAPTLYHVLRDEFE